ncbi:S-adenosyl-L-methionine-dependent methyltransferase [Xylaria bambusicola]|uniref:S-adenosyl-L-methionine-dependent methyltransferase n=1 Tax=Xylaria bambusicola TaxID=326684 RepID=UPI002007D112|nr:S-adenosyl-L-methionine-dependent methyltransferase [Xylaria bambusicola]KAI0513123.1 S-adenosyl-L-methionine-dependent methyltransferase [Xylaria bambusicola]
MSTEEHEKREHPQTQKRLRQKRNPIEVAINKWYEKHAVRLNNQHNVNDLTTQAPRRWTAYGPLVLLPAGSFTSAAWCDALILPMSEDDVDLRDPKLLWKMILEEISQSPKAKLTHLAINEGIPLHSRGSNEGTREETTAHASENILRSPGGLRMLYGDFGPSTLSTSTSNLSEDPLQPVNVTEEDFSRAFWVSTKQNGITQIWAPRWTMFSRGNIKEKARLLDFHDAKSSTTSTRNQQDYDLTHRHIPAKQRRGALAVDLYAGIGYFAFCYATLGFRVLCWELNPWSVEGLRRGAEANGWSVRVVHPPPKTSGTVEEEEKILRDILAGDEIIVVFLEDNTRAADRIRRLDELTRERETQQRDHDEDENGTRTELRMNKIMHVNCGLLPTSRGSWATAWDITSEAQRAWFHIHENVGVSDIETMRKEICEWFVARERLLERDGDADAHRDVCAEHIELVKTFAPGVWHCVFDLYVKKSTDRNDSTT